MFSLGARWRFKKAPALSPLALNHAFESDVCKIQASKYKDLLPKEEEMCKCLLKDSFGIIEMTTDDSPTKMSNWIKRMKEDTGEASSVNPYHDCVSYSALQQRLSNFGARRCTYTVKKDVEWHLCYLRLYYLKENRKFWDKATVVQAMENMKARAEDA